MMRWKFMDDVWVNLWHMDTLKFLKSFYITNKFCILVLYFWAFQYEKAN